MLRIWSIPKTRRSFPTFQFSSIDFSLSKLTCGQLSSLADLILRAVEMNDSDQDKPEQRTNSTMEDSTTMTIEFLRARLLSERSVSKSVGQRAEELEKRVLELEEQLKIVTDQRKRAEKATADVLAILGNNGISDLSEEYDSSFDEENYHESQIGDGSAKEESSVNSNLRRNDSEEIYVSDHEFSPLTGRSLSWKGHRSTSNSPEKYKDSLARRQNSSGSIGFSQSKHVRGKSCRKIKRRELRMAEELKTNNGIVNAHVKGFVNSVENNTSQSEDGAKLLSGCPESGGDKERNMEEALQQQAQLIGRYEAMERAQREWEQKFRENNNSIPDSCDPANHSDVTEERDEIRTNAITVAGTTAFSYQGSKGDQLCVCQEFSKTRSICTSLQPHTDISHMQDHRCSSLAPETFGSKSQSPVATFPTTRQYLGMENQQRNQSQPSFSSACQKSHSISPTRGTQFDRAETPGTQNEPCALVPQGTSSEFTDVLDALKQAKLSLQKKANIFSVVQKGAFGQLIEPSIPVTDSARRLGIPVGCTALFRVPADFDADNSKPDFLGSGRSGSRLNLARYYPDAYAALTSSNQLVTSSAEGQVVANLYRDSNSRSSAALNMSSYANFDELVPSRYPYPETMPSTSIDNQIFNFQMSGGLSGSNPYNYNPPAFPSYPNLLQPKSSRDGNPSSITSMAEASPDRFSFYDNAHFKPDHPFR